ncbi:hypothetical protein [Spiroplasma eriocheiris]|uniref:Uncharacterized protein n=1 Tax=Spiroplasma eriocheiris TaxID=315358 RepID=A0A0H3XJH2_9MOLU|nr:hypothetical protein [Spiroplasma eriocheiris]AHF57540.1 hypothetical protein SPE_0411 [Spiroplasma eriocheiris CCTCC M 207170]AKM53996.1 hypothetical protein SERIO_v1c04170 [Spiroplasma eriocheiris]
MNNSPTSVVTFKKLHRKKRMFAIFNFSLMKLSHLITLWVFFLLSLTVMIVCTMVFFLSAKDGSSFLVNYQYLVLIFTNLLLLLLTVICTIKLFSNQFEDNSFLLLITKPYSRFSIILWQLISVFLL